MRALTEVFVQTPTARALAMTPMATYTHPLTDTEAQALVEIAGKQ